MGPIGSPEVPCEAPPQDASQAQIDCYDDACAAYQKAIKACDGSEPCITAAQAAYAFDLMQCQSVETTADALVFWFDGEQWHTAWPGDEFPAAALQMSFSI
jgi:hypothetical protein